jgi:type II secretory pathway pseudopilin PulG
MASTIKSDNGVSSGVTGIVQTADSTGQLALQTTTSGGVATTAITIDNSQNVGVGVTPSAWLLNRRAVEVGGGAAAVLALNGTAAVAEIFTNSYRNAAGTYIYSQTGYAGFMNYNNQTGGGWAWSLAPSGTAGTTATFTQAMTLDASGNLLIGQTSASNSVNGLYFSPSGGGSANIVHASGTSSGTGYAYFLYAGGSIGSITQNGTTGVLYNLTSDYRLKNNPVPVTGAKDFVMALQPKTWDWWDGSGKGVGFIAHEFMEVAKYSGHGEKDAVDADGKPVYQSIQPSSSEVMANLVAYIQELSAEVTALKAKIGV